VRPGRLAFSRHDLLAAFAWSALGALREELAYFANCLLAGNKPEIVTPEEALEAVRACLAAEESAAKGSVVRVR